MPKIFNYLNFYIGTSINGTLSLIKRDLIHYKRDFGRWVGVVVQPLLIWFLIGSGLQSIIPSKIENNMNYNQFFFISNLSLSIVFLVSFSAMALIQDRKTGLLAALVLSPLPSFVFALFPVLSMSIFAIIQTVIFAFLGHTLGLTLTDVHWGQLLSASLLACCTIGSISVSIAWIFSSQHVFHAIISLFFIPLWILSGSFYPIQNNYLLNFSMMNPLFHINQLYRKGFLGEFQTSSTLFLFIMSAICLVISSLVIKKRRSQL